MSLTISESRLKQALEQQRKAQELGMFCLKYNIDKVVLHALAHDEHMKEEKRKEAIIAGRYEQ